MNALILLQVLFFTLTLSGTAESNSVTEEVSAIPFGVIDNSLLGVGYSGREKLVYDVSWSGGIKIGELHLEIKSIQGENEAFEIRARITTSNGAINLIYPIEDLHVTRVRGPKRLPYHYEVWQKEGYNYRAHRIMEYDQDKGHIKYTKNDKLAGEFQVNGEVNNEFSSFFNSRLMEFMPGHTFIVPTFADKRRVEVAVHVMGREEMENTILGPVDTIAVMPIMKFEGLYEKKGDTVIWYTDDECRVPVRVNSKIAIGSLTAELTAYENPAAGCYSLSVE
ncbi:MAG: DUF3108 domain-containing protein [Desulforhopalus sp.]